MLSSLPSELMFRVLENLPNSKDVQSCGRVSRNFHQVVESNSHRLARPHCSCKVFFDEDRMEIMLDGIGGRSKTTFVVRMSVRLNSNDNQFSEIVRWT